MILTDPICSPRLRSRYVGENVVDDPPVEAIL
jgi:hypothetical protein